MCDSLLDYIRDSYEENSPSDMDKYYDTTDIQWSWIKDANVNEETKNYEADWHTRSWRTSLGIKLKLSGVLWKK